MTKRFLYALLMLSLLWPAYVWASTYTRGTTWSSGQTLTHTALNAEFDLLKTAVDDNAADIATNTADISALETALTAARNVYIATGTSTQNTTSTSYVDVTDLSLTQTFAAADIVVIAVFRFSISGGADTAHIIIDIDGANVTNSQQVYAVGAGNVGEARQLIAVWNQAVTAGSHTIKVQAKTIGGQTLAITTRHLIVEEH